MADQVVSSGASPSGEGVEALARQYLAHFEAHEIGPCMEFFTEDSTVEFMGQFRGLKDIEEWHKARFAAGLKMVRLDRVTASGNEVVLEGAATSARLRAWRIKSVNGKVTARFDGNKIKTLSFAVRS